MPSSELPVDIVQVICSGVGYLFWCWSSVLEVFRFAFDPEVDHRLDSRCQISDQTLELRLIAGNEIRCWARDQMSDFRSAVSFDSRCRLRNQMSHVR